MSAEAEKMQEDHLKYRLEQQKCEFFADMIKRNPRSSVKNPVRRMKEERFLFPD